MRAFAAGSALVLAVGLGAPSVAAAGGCSSSSCSVDPDGGLPEAEFHRLLDQWRAEPLGAATLSVETLLFHGARTRALVEALPPDALDAERRAWLLAELDRDSATVEMRLVDVDGRVRGSTRSDVPLVSGNRLALEGTGDLGFLVTGGKVKRVGLDHLWSRW